MQAAPTTRLVRFESFEVDLRTGELWKNGEKVKLPEQSFQVLAMLVARPGEVVMRQEIQKRLWPNDTVVEFENSINAAVKNLRSPTTERKSHWPRDRMVRFKFAPYRAASSTLFTPGA